MAYLLPEHKLSNFTNSAFRVSAYILLTFCVIKEHCAIDSMDNCKNICLSKECVDYASDVWNKIDESLDPCSNFYNFACSKFPENTYLVNTKRNLIPLIISKSTMFNRLRNIILGKDITNTGNMAQKREIIYESCVKSDSRKHEVKSLVNSISSIITNWPHPTSNYEEADLTAWMSKLILLKEFSFLTLDIEHRNFEEMRKFSERFATIFPPNLESKTTLKFSPQRSFLVRDHVDWETDALREYLTDTLESAGMSSQLVEEILEDAFRIDTFLRTMFSQDSDEEQGGGRTQLECDRNGNNRCCELLDLIIEQTGTLLNTSGVQMSLANPRLLEALNVFLSEESKSSIANYLAVRFLHDNVKIVDFFTEKNETDLHTISNKHYDLHMLDRHERCTFFVAEYLPYTLIEDYLRSTDGMKKLELIIDILDRIRKEAIFLSNSTSWSEELKREFSIVVHETVVNSVEYIRYITQKLDLENRFGTLQVHADSFASNIIEAKRMKQFDHIVHYLNGLFFLMLTYSNEFYIGAGAGEEIEFGMGLLEKRYIGSHRPKYADFSAFGAILSHELGHSLTPVIYNFIEANYTDTPVLMKFEQCLKDTFSNFKVPTLGTAVDGENTFSENLADFIGVTLSYGAFKTYISEKGVESILPGLNFTNEEMFFISYAQNWCEFGYKKGFDYYKEDIHSPSEHRVNGPLMNIHSFGNIFKCPLGSYMNPPLKCNFWQ